MMGAEVGGRARARSPGWGSRRARVLVSFTPGYALYGKALLRKLRGSRPNLSVVLALFPEAAETAARLKPHLVVSDGAVPAPGAKVRLSAEPTEPSTLRAGGVVRRIVNPTFDDLLAFVNGVGRPANSKPGPQRAEEPCSPG